MFSLIVVTEVATPLALSAEENNFTAALNKAHALIKDVAGVRMVSVMENGRPVKNVMPPK